MFLILSLCFWVIQVFILIQVRWCLKFTNFYEIKVKLESSLISFTVKIFLLLISKFKISLTVIKIRKFLNGKTTSTSYVLICIICPFWKFLPKIVKSPLFWVWTVSDLRSLIGIKFSAHWLTLARNIFGALAYPFSLPYNYYIFYRE